MPPDLDPPPEPLRSRPNVERASIIMMVSLLLSRILGIVRDTIMSAQFGRNATTDAYSLAFMIPDLLFFLIAGGALSSAFIPVFSEYLHTGRRKEAWQVFRGVVNLMSLALAVVIGLAWFFSDSLVRLIVDPAQAAQYPLIASMSRILLPAQFAFFIGGLMFGTLYAHQRFSIPGLGPNVYNLGIILGAVAISHFVSPGIVGMAWGALIGAFIGNVVIPAFALRHIGVEWRPSLEWGHPGVKKVFVLMLPVVLGLSLPGVYALLMRYFGSAYEGGIVTAIDLANKLMQAPLGVLGQSFAIAIFPALSQFWASKELTAFRSQTVKTLRMVLFATVPVGILLAVLAPEVVNVLFNHGKFRETDASPVVLALQLFCIGIPAWCLHPVLMRAYFAMQRSVKPIVLGTATTALFVALCLTLRETPLAWAGLPLASSVSAIALASVMTWTLSRDLGELNLADLLRGLDHMLLAGLGMTAVAVALARVLPGGAVGDPLGLSLGRAVAVAGGGCVAYMFISQRFALPEIALADRALQRAKMRSKPAKE